jgi:hypothetical protein
LRHNLHDISKIEYEHYSTSDSGHKEDSRSCKQAKRRRQEQAKALQHLKEPEHIHCDAHVHLHKEPKKKEAEV